MGVESAETLQRKVKKLEDDVKEREKKLSVMQTNLETQKIRTSELKEKIGKLEDTVAKKDDEIVAKNNEVKGKQRDIDKEKSKAKDLEEVIGDKSKTITVLNEQIEFEQQKIEQERQATALKIGNLKDTKARVSQLEADLQRDRDQFSAFIDKHDIVDKERISLQAQLEMKTQECNDVSTHLQGANQELEEKTQDLKVKTQKIETLIRDLAVKESEHQLANEKAVSDNTTANLGTWKADCAERRSAASQERVKDMTKLVKVLEGDLQAKDQSLRASVKQLEDCQQEAASVKKEMQCAVTHNEMLKSGTSKLADTVSSLQSQLDQSNKDMKEQLHKHSLLTSEQVVLSINIQTVQGKLDATSLKLGRMETQLKDQQRQNALQQTDVERCNKVMTDLKEEVRIKDQKIAELMEQFQNLKILCDNKDARVDAMSSRLTEARDQLAAQERQMRMLRVNSNTSEEEQVRLQDEVRALVGQLAETKKELSVAREGSKDLRKLLEESGNSMSVLQNDNTGLKQQLSDSTSAQKQLHTSTELLQDELQRATESLNEGITKKVKLEEELSIASTSLVKMQLTADAATTTAAEAEARRGMAAENVKALEIETQRLLTREQQLVKEAAGSGERLTQKLKELEGLEEELHTFEIEFQTNKWKLQLCDQRDAFQKQQLASKSDQLEELKKRLLGLNKKVATQDEAVASLQETSSTSQQQQKMLMVQVQSLLEEVSTKEKAVAAGVKQLEGTHTSLAQKEQVNSDLGAEVVDLKQQVEGVTGQLATRSDQLGASRAEAVKLQDDIQNLSVELKHCKMQLHITEALHSSKSTDARVWEDMLNESYLEMDVKDNELDLATKRQDEAVALLQEKDVDISTKVDLIKENTWVIDNKEEERAELQAKVENKEVETQLLKNSVGFYTEKLKESYGLLGKVALTV